jgi:hypothetical protein
VDFDCHFLKLDYVCNLLRGLVLKIFKVLKTYCIQEAQVVNKTLVTTVSYQVFIIYKIDMEKPLLVTGFSVQTSCWMLAMTMGKTNSTLRQLTLFFDCHK